MMGAKAMQVDQVPSGNLVALVGIDKFLLKTGTITTYEHAHNMRVSEHNITQVQNSCLLYIHYCMLIGSLIYILAV